MCWLEMSKDRMYMARLNNNSANIALNSPQFRHHAGTWRKRAAVDAFKSVYYKMKAIKKGEISF